jgi:hypothetical protein
VANLGDHLEEAEIAQIHYIHSQNLSLLEN